MILTFCGHNYTMLQVTNATPEEMQAIKAAVTEKVNAFQARKHDNWNGDVSMVWYVNNYFYIPAGCWQRIWNLRFPDPQRYRPAYNVEFRNQDKFFNKTITIEEVADFVATLNPAFDDVTDQVTVLHSILRHRLSSHNIATGFGKTYLAYLLAQYTAQQMDGKTLLIAPRVLLVEQGMKDFTEYMQTIAEESRLQCYGICGSYVNKCKFADADVYIGTYQSIVNMPADVFDAVKTVICDEGHTAKALSVKDSVSKCTNAEIITAISGTLSYSSGADALTIEQFCGPQITNYSAHQQIEKGRLPKIAVQQIILQHTDGSELYQQLLQQERLPMPTKTSKGNVTYPVELASSYRRIEMQYLSTNLHMLNYILQLCKTITDKGKNVLVLFTNRRPAINLFEYANQQGHKAHLIFGDTASDIRQGVKQQIENEGGWILSATTGTMSMGVSINNLQGIVMCMTGHSPHVTLQAIGRMLRKHKDKFEVTVCYDIVNDCSPIGTHFDRNNGANRMKYYQTEQHPIYPTVCRQAINY